MAQLGVLWGHRDRGGFGIRGGTDCEKLWVNLGGHGDGGAFARGFLTWTLRWLPILERTGQNYAGVDFMGTMQSKTLNEDDRSPLRDDVGTAQNDTAKG